VKPYFSIVIPMFNRERFINRAITRCLSQKFEDFEIIVVDDGSSNRSVSVVESIDSPKLRLLRQPINRGVCRSRNRGIAASSGTWVVCLDSDDELTEDALARMHETCEAAPPDAGVVHFMCVLDDGTLSPDPPFQTEIWDYDGFLRWRERTSRGRSESLLCARRSTFENCRSPDDRSLEAHYNFELARRYRTVTSTFVARMYHRDADNSITWSPVSQTTLSRASDQALQFEKLLQTHGDAMKVWSPTSYFDFLRGSATQWFLAGQRQRALRQICRYLRERPASPGIVGLALLGLAGPSALLKAKELRDAIGGRA
jgi:glycosyltransferase involved in cell wall biosynthesis